MSDRGHILSSGSADSRRGREKNAGAGTTGGIEHLDFGVRNTLLYYRDLKATLDLTPGSDANEDAVRGLLMGGRMPLSALFDHDPEALRSAGKRVRAISYRARRDMDKGTPGTLCVAWGLATWDNGRSTVPAAPIVLRQAAVARHVGTAEDFDLVVNGPWNLNVTLLRLLEIDFGVDVDREALRQLVEELAVEGDPSPLFERVAKEAVDVPGFEVTARVVMAPVPRVAMVVANDLAPAGPVLVDFTPEESTVDSNGVDANTVDANAVDPNTVDAPVAGGGEGGTARTPEAEVVDEETSDDTVELFRSGVLNPKTMAEGSLVRRTVERFGPDVIIADINDALRGDGWPEALIEHAHSGLRVRDRGELLQRWYDASSQRPRPSGWDATHFALWGLTAAPPAGNPAIRSVARWGERKHHPILMAWEMVAEHREWGRRGRHGRQKKVGWRTSRVTFPRGMDEALWGLPVDLLVEWTAWAFRLWPGAPYELVLPAGSPELVSAWYERARPVAELAVKTWTPFSQVDGRLGKSAHRWVKHLTNACGGGGAPLATWFERSTAVATEAVALRVGAGGVLRGRKARAQAGMAHAEHAL
jgi:hypothetical protein